MYKVLDKVTKERLTVSAIDVSKHLHIGGLEFTPAMLDGLETVSTKKAPKVEEIVEEVVEAPKKTGKGK